MKALILISLMAVATAAAAQEVKITQMELQASGDIVVTYNLNDERLDRKYALYLYASKDNYIQPLTNVTGDVGVDLSVGENKRLVWHAKEELGATFTGAVGLEVKGGIYVPFVTLDSFDDYKVFKRGKPYDVTWTGGRGDNVLNFELYKGDNKVKVFEERPNVGNTIIIIPRDVKPGRYKFKISDSRNKDEVVYTMEFIVKRKIPLLLQVGVVAAVVGGVTYLIVSAPNEESKIGEPPLPNK